MIRRPPRATQSKSSAASDVYKRQALSYAPVTVSFAKITYANQLAATLTAGNTYISLVEIIEGGTQTQITNNDFADDSILNGSVFYKISS